MSQATIDLVQRVGAAQDAILDILRIAYTVDIPSLMEAVCDHGGHAAADADAALDCLEATRAVTVTRTPDGAAVRVTLPAPGGGP